MIPAKIVITGDVVRGRGFIKFAKEQLNILERLMSFQGLNEGVRTVKPYPGVVVECWSSFSLHEVRIHVEPGKGGDVSVSEEDKKQRCPEFQCYTVGYIVGPTEGLNMDTPERRYDVQICRLRSMYVLLMACKTSDFATYEPDEQVLVHKVWATFPCCLNPDGDYVGFNITPLVCSHPRWINE